MLSRLLLAGRPATTPLALAVCLAAINLSGCDNPDAQLPVFEPMPPADVLAEAQPELKSIIKTGQIGRGMENIAKGVAAVGDEPLRLELQEMIGEMASASDVAVRKEKAQEILDKLIEYNGGSEVEGADEFVEPSQPDAPKRRR